MPLPDIPPGGQTPGAQPPADGDVRALLAEMIEALEAVLATTDDGGPREFDRDEAGSAIREAVRRVNRLRRALNGHGEVA